MKERHKAVPAVYLFLENNGKILFLLRQNTGYCDGDYSVPSGHVEAGELLTDAVIRETEEETGIRVKREDLRLVHTMYRGKHDETGERADFFFVADRWEGEPENREPLKCAEVRWFLKDALPSNIIHFEKLALESIRRGIPFSEYRAGFFSPA